MRKLSLLISFTLYFNTTYFTQTSASSPTTNVKNELTIGKRIIENIYYKSSGKIYPVHFPKSDGLGVFYTKLNLTRDREILYKYVSSEGVADNQDSALIVYKCAAILTPHNIYSDKNWGEQSLHNTKIYLYEKRAINTISKLPQEGSLNSYIYKNVPKLFSGGWGVQEVDLRIYEIIDSLISPRSFTKSKKIILTDLKGKVLMMASSVLEFEKKITALKGKEDAKVISGKLFVNANNKNTPLNLATVSLLSNDSDTLETTKTNKYGDFKFAISSENLNYKLGISIEDKSVQTIILATKEGKEISKLNRGAKGFEYKLIQADINRMLDVEEKEDISATFKNFSKGKNKDIKIEENIIYASGKFEFEKESKNTLDKVVTILKNSPQIKLDVISHTDAIGNDMENMTLSLKRSASVVDYLVSKGINKNRLNSIGKGETEIRNRCKNDVDCTDSEHAYNRRTEFHFIK